MSQSSEDLDAETFGPLLDIPQSSLIDLAMQTRVEVFNTPSSSGRLVSRVAGSYNLVHIVQLDDDFQLVIRVPATGWGDGLTPTAAHAMESQITTLRLIASKTTIPVPQVYAFDATTDNGINAPYICMSFVHGQTLATAWFDTSPPTPLEDRRLKTLTAISQCLAQLAQFSFPKIGSIHKEENGDLTIGPCYDWEEKEDGSFQIIASGPYNTAEEYLQEHYAVTEEHNGPWKVAAAIVTKAASRRLPFKDPSQGFVLSIPDFDSQNIMVDDQGNVTGIIDWDLVQTLPRCVGYSRYPGWITRDWDPIMYGWPKSDSENSPEELEQYRKHYDQAMGEALQHSGDWEFTAKSHIWEAIWIAALNHVNRLEICCKLIQEATGVDRSAARSTMLDIGSGEADWPKLEEQLEAFITKS
ncbi:kinase-like domain-containing protein [Podospora aff. communis PSN243]|uniref:Kinase-like domain-containing protein n=1 Tax=Podospora aff. communis PSN243 TaxID=3040156 RepID=A0AAV9H239_9PEZI|nr:kinase-like domain-containing protein [Podospora aff. communis PSN243]